MNSSLLNILLDPRGKINHQQFRAGMAVVFLMVGFEFSMHVSQALDQIIYARIGQVDLAQFTIHKRLFSGLVPVLIPAWFVVSCASFVLSWKRMKAIGHGPIPAMLLGLFCYLFFALVRSSTFLSIYQFERLSIRQEPSFVDSNTFTIVCSLGLLLGAASIAFLSWRRDQDFEVSKSSSVGSLTQVGYAISLAKIMLVTAVINIVLSYLLYRFASNFAANPLPIFGALFVYLCIVLAFYIRYAAFRLKDAGYSFFWIVGVLLLTCFVISTKLWCSYSNTVLPFAMHILLEIILTILVASSYLLFLLPSKAEQVEASLIQSEVH